MEIGPHSRFRKSSIPLLLDLRQTGDKNGVILTDTALNYVETLTPTTDH